MLFFVYQVSEAGSACLLSLLSLLSSPLQACLHKDLCGALKQALSDSEDLIRGKAKKGRRYNDVGKCDGVKEKNPHLVFLQNVDLYACLKRRY